MTNAPYSPRRARSQELDDDVWMVVMQLEMTEPPSHGGFQSIEQFVKRLGVREVIEAADIACSKVGDGDDRRLFKYFCGVCWNKVDAERDWGGE